MPNSDRVINTYDLSSSFEAEQALKKANLLDSSLLSFAIASILHITFFYLTGNFVGATITVIFTLGIFSVLFLSKKNVIPFRTLNTLYPLLLHLLILSIVLITGGMTSPFIIWYGVVFSVAYFYGSTQKGLMWVGIGSLHLLAIGVVDYFQFFSLKNYGVFKYQDITNYYSGVLMLLYLGKAFYQYEKWHVNSQLELKDLNDEVIAQNEELQQHKEEILTQNERLEKSQKTLLASLNYGRKIQLTLFRFEHLLKNNFQESFVFQRPRDIVSGDFYWYKEIGSKVFVAVADCTGHGIPSAFLTIIGASNLQHILTQEDLNPANILHILNEKILTNLNQNRDEGMDIGIMIFDKKKQELIYSGANTPLYFVRAGVLEQFKGAKAPIGDRKIKNKVFTNTTIQLQKGDQFYLASDGFQDQFGGREDRKYLKKRFREMLLEYSHLPMNRQRMKIEQEFTQWKQSRKQTDDILVLGVKV